MYFCSALYRGKTAPQSDHTTKTALGVDAVLAVSTLALSILAIIGSAANLEALVAFQALYPTGAYTLLGASILVAVGDFALFSVRKAAPSVSEKKALSNPTQAEDQPHTPIEGHSPISLSSWSEIPENFRLMLSDGCFYDLRPNESDLVYLHEQLGEGGQKDAPQGSKFTDQDQALFQAKVQKLGLGEKDMIALEDGGVQTMQTANYRALENLIGDLLEMGERGNLQEVLIPYLDDLREPDIRALTLPDLAYVPIGETQLVQFHPHKLALYLWNALKQTEFEFPLPADILVALSLQHGIALSD